MDRELIKRLVLETLTYGHNYKGSWINYEELVLEIVLKYEELKAEVNYDQP